VKRLVLFFCIAFGFTWIVWGARLYIGSAAGIDVSSHLLNLLDTIGLFGPFVGAVLVTLSVSGVGGLRRFLKESFRWRLHPIWYLLPLLTGGAIFAAAILIQSLVEGKPFSVSFQVPAAGLIIVFNQLWVMIGEETGWRGFALPRMLEKMGALGAALSLGVIWAAWHLPLFLLPGSNQYGSPFATYTLAMMGWSIIHVMLFLRSGGSILPNMLFHGATNTWIFILVLPQGLELYFAVVLAMVVGVSISLLPKPLFRKKREALKPTLP
jgi:uncharacterized protein